VEPNTHRHIWYLRDGSRAKPLSEPQVALAYRDRFAGRADIDRQVRSVFDEGTSQLNREKTVWLAAAVVPGKAATRRALDRRLLDDFKKQTEERQQALPGASLGHHAAFGRGRVVLRDSQPGELIGDHLLHLYADGSAFAAVALDVAREAAVVDRVRRQRPELRPDVRCIRVGSITTWVLTLLGIGSGHSVDAGGAGDLELLCGIVVATEDDTNAPGSDAEPPALQHVVLDQPWRHSSGESIVPTTTWRDHLTPVQLTFSAAAAGDGRELITVGAQVVSELVAEFGFVPSDPLLSTDGFVVAENCQGARLEGLRAWAEWRGLLTSQQT